MGERYLADGDCTVTPYIVVPDAAEVIRFLEITFDAEVTSELALTTGEIMKAEVCVGDSQVMIADARDNMPPSPATLYVNVTDVDGVFRRGIAAGASILMEPSDLFHGDRFGGMRDPGGNNWWLATHSERDEQQPTRPQRMVQHSLI